MARQELPITGLQVGTVNPDVIVCGDPDRAAKIAGSLEDGRLMTNRREYRSFSASYRGLPLSVCSHGVGAPGAAIAFEELIIAGARRIVRVGTCGGLRPEVLDGHLVIAVAAVQNTGYVREVAPQGYPAVADPRLTSALQQAAENYDFKTHSGLVLTRDAFYGGVQAPALPDYKIMAQANVLAVEMECAALFTIALLRGIQAAAVLAVDGNVLESSESVESYRPDREVVAQAVNAASQLAVEALAGGR